MDMARKYGLLIGGFGFSYLGNWIYLVALNLFVWHLTASPAAMAGIFIVGPIARVLTSFIAGSIIDRTNKRKIMILSDIVRGSIVFFLPFMESIWLIYALLFLANIASSFFGPSSTYYITKYVSMEDKQRFNALLGTFNSGSFLVGPALAGVLIMLFNTTIAIWINSFTFFVCAFVIYSLPDVDDTAETLQQRVTWRMLKSDYLAVVFFIRKNGLFLKIYLLFQCSLMIAFALDSQEATFIKKDLALSDGLYGTIVSIAGVGSIVGGIVAASFAKKWSLRSYIAVGLLMTMVFYTTFYASTTSWMAVVSFVALGFFMAFSNAGYDTFYQQSVPPELMGRFGSVANIFQSVLQILFTLLLGLFAQCFNLQMTAIVFGVFSILLSVALFFVLYAKAASHKLKGEVL
ncbi:MFS transporter [Lysinibacillus sphaericus]|uniref:Major facilitator superfamily protein n=1 Tax=Lysinibacillus sphaericus OT4b.31 TaxID=1285586 RepID=R7ZJA7_LYSSH|nr:MFS transporter [Lysinibacillus sphaericus]EON74136.1 major facilitator superfamily protein [Lysinibacillus sphaericus OT4b.31]